MSRVGKNPVVLPAGVEATFKGRDITIKGSKGTLDWTIPFEISFEQAENEITFTVKKETKDSAALWGLTRALVANMVEGVSNGYSKKLEIHGVGYRSAVAGNKLSLSVGYSHGVELEIPAGLTAVVEKNTKITVSGVDKQAVGQFAANIRAVRKPEPYKGKGIRYADERIIRKEGKKK
jgi:large subunit ribosomal protein L6